MHGTVKERENFFSFAGLGGGGKAKYGTSFLCIREGEGLRKHLLFDR
jgi:hypothetical protein